MGARIDGAKVALLRVTPARDFGKRGRAWARRLPLLALMFSGCTCGSNTPAPPAPTPNRQAPPTAARASDLPATAPTSAGANAPAAAAPAPNDPARRATCERYVAVLSGKQTDPSLLASDEVQWLAAASRPLVTCGAIAADNVDACKSVSQWRPCPTCEKVGTPGPKRPITNDCYSSWAIFHELKTNAKSRAYMLEECLAPDQEWADLCGGITQGLRSGDCSAAGKAEPLCRAFMTLDPALCAPIEGLPSDLPDSCRQRIAWRGFLAKGLAPLADTPISDPAVTAEFGDPVRLQMYAGAALGRADSCRTFEAEALKFCTENQMMVAPPTIAAAAPVAETPAAPPPPTPAPQVQTS